MKVIHRHLASYMQSEGYTNWTAQYSGSIEANVSGSNRLMSIDNTEEYLIRLEGIKTSGSGDPMINIDISSIEAGYSASAGL